MRENNVAPGSTSQPGDPDKIPDDAERSIPGPSAGPDPGETLPPTGPVLPGGASGSG